jgi:hypothetical protein
MPGSEVRNVTYRPSVGLIQGDVAHFIQEQHPRCAM